MPKAITSLHARPLPLATEFSTQTRERPRLRPKQHWLYSDRMLGDPRSGSKVWKAPDREIGKTGENRGKVIAHRDLQPTAAFHDRENRRNLRSRLWAADVQPILPSIEIFRCSKLCSLQNYVQSASPGCLSDHEQPAFEREVDVCRDTTEVADCP
jgi:hypothetical protein